MTWSNRPGQDIEQRFNDLEKQFGLDNLVDLPIETSFPEAGPESTSIHLVSDSGTLYLVILAKGLRYRTAFTSF